MNSWTTLSIILGLLFIGSISLDYSLYVNNEYVPLNLGTYVPTVNNVDVSPHPPITENTAVKLALNYGGWNENSLRGMNIFAYFEYMKFQYSANGWGYEMLGSYSSGQVTNNGVNVTDYNSVQNGTTTFRYVWAVIVQYNGPVTSIPPPGYYFVDAVTGEIIPIELL